MGKTSKNIYKTIRHGENSLQYTILPQNDDFRLEGKIKSVESTKRTPVRIKKTKPRRRSFFAYLGVIFVCTVIVGAILIPFLVSAECMPNPKDWFLKTKAAFTGGGGGTKSNSSYHWSHSTQLQQHSAAAAMVNRGNLMMSNGVKVGKTVQIISQDGIEKIILKVNKTKSAGVNTKENDKQEPQSTITVQALNVDSNLFDQPTSFSTLTELSNIKPHIAPTTITLDRNINQQQQTAAIPLDAEILATHSTNFIISPIPPAVPDTTSSTVISTSSPRKNSSAFYTLNNNRVMQVPLLKGGGNKKAGIPPVLVKNYSKLVLPTTPTTQSTKSVTNAALHDNNIKNNDHFMGSTVKNNNQNNSDWIQTHWPFIDPSTYFQWNGYKAEDSVLLPALLGFALIGIILTITVCIVARNKRSIVTTVRKRNRHDGDETASEDNATLLTATSLSDED